MSKIIECWIEQNEAEHGHYASFAGFEDAIRSTELCDAYDDMDIDEKTLLFEFVAKLLEAEALGVTDTPKNRDRENQTADSKVSTKEGPHFKVMFPYADRCEQEHLGCPSALPWGLMELHEKQALINHGRQGLQVLNTRGGLTPRELAAVLGDRHWSEMRGMSLADAVATVKTYLAAYFASTEEDFNG